jgi:hypothetical protein
MLSAKSAAAAEGASLSRKRSSRLPALVFSFVTSFARKDACIGSAFHSLLRRRECSALGSTTHRNYPLKAREQYLAHWVQIYPPLPHSAIQRARLLPRNRWLRMHQLVTV